MTLYVLIETILFIMCILMSIASIGAKSQSVGWRCVVLSAVFCAAILTLTFLKR